VEFGEREEVDYTPPKLAGEIWVVEWLAAMPYELEGKGASEE